MPRHILVVFICLAATLCVPVELVHGQERNLVDQVLDLYLPDGDGETAGSRGCATSLMRRVRKNWNSFQEEDRIKLRPYVLQPGQDRPDDAPGAPGDSGFEYAKTKHFLVFWQDSGVNAVRPGDDNGNKVPDYVERVGTYLEAAYAAEIGKMGFDKPPTAPKYRVYLKGFNHNGLTHPGQGNETWIEIHSNIEAYTRGVLGPKFGPHVTSDPEGYEVGLLKAVCAHEFFHAIQAVYNWEQPDWWAEGSAEWMGEMVFPESDFYLNNLALHLEQPHISLFSNDLWFEYSSSIFTGFLVENLGGPKILKRVWEACRQSDILKALDRTVGDTKELFTAFWAYNYLRAYKDGAKYPVPEVLAVKAYPFTLKSSDIAEPQYYGANLIRFEDLDPSANLTLTIQPGKGIQLGAKLIRIDAAKKWRIVKIGGSGGNIQASVTGATQAVLVIGNFTKEGKNIYSLSASY